MALDRRPTHDKSAHLQTRRNANGPENLRKSVFDLLVYLPDYFPFVVPSLFLLAGEQRDGEGSTREPFHIFRL